MSYILDALRKSDLQRQHGMAPTLQSTALLGRTPENPHTWIYLVLAAFLVAAGVAIGWLRPWQTDSTTNENRNVTPTQTRDLMNAPPVLLESVVTPEPARTRIEPQPHHAPPSVPVTPKKTPAAATASAEPTAGAAESKVLAVTELPPAIQQEIPPLTITVHAYSARPADRMVGINNSMLREGSTVAPGLRLDEITPEGMVLSYKGYRFKRGVQN